MAAVPEGDEDVDRRAREAGFSLMEIVVAIGVFGVLALACAGVAIDSLGTAGDNRERVRAANLANAEIERTRAQFRVSPGNVPETLVVTPTTVDGNHYTVRRTATWLDVAGADNLGGVSYTAATGDVLRVEVTVSWPDLGDRPPVINTTVLS